MKRQMLAASVAVAAVFIMTGCAGQGSLDSAAPSPTAPATGTSTDNEPRPTVPAAGTSAATAAVESSNHDHDHAESIDPAADEVAEEAALALVSWDTTRDKTETAAAVRAKPLMTEELAARTVEPERNSSQALWNQLQPLGARSEPKNNGTVASEHPPEDTPTTVYRNYRMTWSWITADGKTAPVQDNRARNVYLSLVKVGDSWKVADYLTSDMPGK